MAEIRNMKRQRTRSKRLDLAPLKEILKDRRCWVCMGVVVVPDGESSHFELVDGDVLVDVETQPDQEDMTCRLAGSGGNDRGLWQIPNVGDEVMVVLPAGEREFMPTIIGVLSTGKTPNGVAANVTVIADGEVQIHNNGAVDSLVKKLAYSAHVHPTGTGPSGPPDNASAPASYTTVLKGE